VYSLRIDTDFELSVPSRVLDLLVAQGRLPHQFDLALKDERYGLTISFTDLSAHAASIMVARIRQMPGVLQVEQRALRR
jgi:hypothetical protein